MKTKGQIFIFASILIGIGIGIFFMNNITSESKFEDAALGKATTSHYAEDAKGKKIHYLPHHNPNEFLSNIQPYLNNKIALYLGNSQSHSINQKVKGDNTMSGYLFEDLIQQDIFFLTASIPNANLQEHYLLYNYFRNNTPNINLLVLPIFMDDLRETGIRENYFRNFSDSAFFIKEDNTLATEINEKIISFKEEKEGNPENEKDLKALDKTTQENVERYLNQSLNENLSFWNNRKEIRGKYFTSLYKGRNTLLNISSQTTRKMIPSRYKKNINALKLMLDVAQKDSTKILLVIPPIRKDIKFPYDIKEYKNFKSELSEIASTYNAKLIDVDYIIDGKYWGYSAPTQLFKKQDYDFMHFQAKAHKILADSLKPYILKELWFLIRLHSYYSS